MSVCVFLNSILSVGAQSMQMLSLLTLQKSGTQTIQVLVAGEALDANQVQITVPGCGAMLLLGSSDTQLSYSCDFPAEVPSGTYLVTVSVPEKTLQQRVLFTSTVPVAAAQVKDQPTPAEGLIQPQTVIEPEVINPVKELYPVENVVPVVKKRVITPVENATIVAIPTVLQKIPVKKIVQSVIKKTEAPKLTYTGNIKPLKFAEITLPSTTVSKTTVKIVGNPEGAWNSMWEKINLVPKAQAQFLSIPMIIVIDPTDPQFKKYIEQSSGSKKTVDFGMIHEKKPLTKGEQIMVITLGILATGGTLAMAAPIVFIEGTTGVIEFLKSITGMKPLENIIKGGGGFGGQQLLGAGAEGGGAIIPQGQAVIQSGIISTIIAGIGTLILGSTSSLKQRSKGGDGGGRSSGDGCGGNAVGNNTTSVLSNLFRGQTPKASELINFALQQGWKLLKSETGPRKFFDENGIERMTIKHGSPRTPGSESPHISIKNTQGKLIDPCGNQVKQKDPDNHIPIIWDL